MKKITTFLLSVTCLSLGYSQTKQDPKGSNQSADNVSKIRVFTPSSSVTTSGETYKWAVKTDIFSILTGEFPIIGEYRIGKKFSVEASAGLTYGFMTTEGLFYDDALNEVADNGTYYEGEEAEMGSAFRGTIKYFPSSDYDAIEGWYFGVQAMTKTINKSYSESSQLSGNEDTLIKTGASIVIGKQVFTDSNIVWDFYFGAGIAKTTHKFVSSNYDFDTDTYYYFENENSKSKPNILMGLRIGFGN